MSLEFSFKQRFEVFERSFGEKTLLANELFTGISKGKNKVVKLTEISDHLDIANCLGFCPFICGADNIFVLHKNFFWSHGDHLFFAS